MRKLRWAIQIIVPLALAFLVFKSWDSLGEFWIYIQGGEIDGQAVGGLTAMSLLILSLQIPAQLLSYVALAQFYQSYFVQFSRRANLRLREVYRIALELNFISSVLPSGGVSGFSYLSLRLRPKGVTVASSTIAQGLRFALTFLSFMPILALGLFVMALDSRTNNLVLLYGSGVFLMMVLITLVGWFLISDSRRIRKLVGFLPTAMRWVGRRLPILRQQKLVNVSKVNRVLNEIHADYVTLKNEPTKLLRLFNYALAINFFEVLTACIAYLAFYTVFGEFINPGAVALAYLTANFAGLIAILPGGIGVFEGLMIVILTASGTSEDLALAGTLAYRVINLVIFVPIGYILYQKVFKQLGGLAAVPPPPE